MNNPTDASDPTADASREEVLSAHFASLVMQNVNMALLCLGKAPHPDTGEHIKDLESARHFIDQLEMLEIKTRGNLDKREAGLLKQSLTTLRMAFVQAADEGPTPPPAAKPETALKPEPAAPQAATTGQTQPPPAAAPTPDPEAEERKKFVKKY